MARGWQGVRKYIARGSQVYGKSKCLLRLAKHLPYTCLTLANPLVTPCQPLACRDAKFRPVRLKKRWRFRFGTSCLAEWCVRSGLTGEKEGRRNKKYGAICLSRGLSTLRQECRSSYAAALLFPLLSHGTGHHSAADGRRWRNLFRYQPYRSKNPTSPLDRFLHKSSDFLRKFHPFLDRNFFVQL